MSIIEIKNLKKTFKSGDATIYAVDDISFSVQEGEFLAITGRSGSGKSTLLYQLGLLDTPTSGMIIISGHDISLLNHDERTAVRLNDLGYVFQDYANLPSLSAIENVMLPLLMQGLNETMARKKAGEALARVGLGDRLDNVPSELSGGQQQRVAIARAIAHEPKIIFADEPTANLDSETSETVLQVFLDLHTAGQTILMVTHELEYANLAERILVLSDGKLISDEKVKK